MSVKKLSRWTKLLKKTYSNNFGESQIKLDLLQHRINPNATLKYILEYAFRMRHRIKHT